MGYRGASDMTTTSKIVCTAGVVGAILAALAACEPYPYNYYGPGYGPPSPGYPYPYYGPEAGYGSGPSPGWAGGYEDPCDTDSSYCGYGYYDGPLWFDGGWYAGPHRWRNWQGTWQFYVHGGWQTQARVGRGGYWHVPGRYSRP
jgi:hypothetical protein